MKKNKKSPQYDTWKWLLPWLSKIEKNDLDIRSFLRFLQDTVMMVTTVGMSFCANFFLVLFVTGFRMRVSVSVVIFLCLNIF